MDSVGVRELRQNLSVYLRRVQTGEALRVTDHGVPVALLTPLPPDDDPFADLVASGRAVPPERPFGGARYLTLPDEGGPTLSEVLQQMRDEDDR